VKDESEAYYRGRRREHPELRLHPSEGEYELLKSIAEREGMSMRDVVLKAVRGVRESFEKGVREGLSLAVSS